MRPNVFGKAMALDGDITTTGATCIATIQTATFNGKRVLRVGDPTTTCPKCGNQGNVVTGENQVDNHGKAQAVHGSIVQCGCPFGSNTVIAVTPLVSHPSTAFNATASPVPKNGLTAQPHQSQPASFSQLPVFTVCNNTEKNPLQNGVFVWTEIENSGHSFISIHKDNVIYLYSYGRYGRTGSASVVGDGILLYMTGADAISYYHVELYRLKARVFQIADVDAHLIVKHFKNLWDLGVAPIPTDEMGELTQRNGKIIDVYDVTGNNCTTYIVKGLKKAGTKLFKDSYTPIRTQYPVHREEAYTIPLSLQKFLLGKSQDLTQLDVVVEVTNEFKKQYQNINNLAPEEKSMRQQILEIIVLSFHGVGGVTDFDGGNTGGLLGSSYEK